MRATLLIGLFAALTLGGSPAIAQESDRPERGTLLQVEAEGSAKAAPDVMSVSASVVTTGATAAEALARNNELAGRLIEAVRASNIRVEQLRTAELSVNAQFAEDERGRSEEVPRILGYVARNTLLVDLAEVAQAGDLISLMFEAGANGIGGPMFQLSDPVPLRRQAERAAIANATAEAESYAGALGMRVARVLRVSDTRFEGMRGSSIVVSGSRIRATPIEPGEVTVSQTVFVEFLLEPL